MNDLLRSYKMILKRRNSIDSDESQPLVSSQSSIASFGAFQDQCMFHNSDSTDCEVEKSTKPVNQIQTTPKQLLRRPFSYPGQYDVHLPNFDIFAANDDTRDKYKYFAKLSGILSENNFLSSTYLPFKYDKLEAIKTQNSLVTIFAIWNTIMGTSLLAMAWGFERSGLISGIILHLVMAGICLYTAQLVLSISKNYGVAGKITEVPELCRKLLGRWAEIVARIFSLIVLIGANIVYWILMSNFLYNFVEFLYEYVTLPEKPDNRTILCPKLDIAVTMRNSSSLELMRSGYFYEIWSLYRTVPLFLAILMFPLLNFKSPTFFTKFNSLGTLSALYMVVFVCAKSYSWGINDIDWIEELNFKPSFSALSGMLALSYFIHNIIITVMRSNRNQEHNVRDLSIAYGLVLFTYLFVGVFVYICFPLAKSCIEDNILNNFPKYDPLTIGARVLLLFQLFTVFPLMAFMLRLDIFNNFKAIFVESKCTEFSYFKVIILNVALVIVCVLFALFLPKIGTLIRYTGAMSGMVYVFTLPSLMKMAALRNEKALTPLKTIVYVCIIIIGITNFCSQFFIADG